MPNLPLPSTVVASRLCGPPAVIRASRRQFDIHSKHGAGECNYSSRAEEPPGGGGGGGSGSGWLGGHSAI